MLKVEISKQFDRDLKKIRKRGANLDELWDIVTILVRSESLPQRHRTHHLSGKWKRAWKCHIRPDWLLIWHETDDSLLLVRTGTHSDLFG
jgi:mRNA interferase YafQ